MGDISKLSQSLVRPSGELLPMETPMESENDVGMKEEGEQEGAGHGEAEQYSEDADVAGHGE